MRATLALNGWRKRENFFNQKKIFGRWKMYLKATKFMFRSDFSMQWVRTKFTPKLFSRNKFWFLNVASSFPLRKLQSARYTFYITIANNITNNSFRAWFLSAVLLTASEHLEIKAFMLLQITATVIARGFEKSER